MSKQGGSARSATMSQIPTKTGAAAAVGLVLPELNGKLDGFAMRIPTLNVSVVDLTFVAARETTVAEIDATVKEASVGALLGILGFGFTSYQKYQIKTYCRQTFGGCQTHA